MAECPNCKISPLSVIWKQGTFDFKCQDCGVDLEPDADAFIDILPDTHNYREMADDEWFST